MSDSDQSNLASNENPEKEIHQEENVTPTGRAFTLKSVLFGVFALLFTIAFTDYSDFYLKQSPFVSNFLPPGPMMLVLSIALIWNPMWCKRISLPFVGLGICTLIGAYLSYVHEQSFFLSAHWLLLIPFAAAYAKPVWEAIAPKMILGNRELLVSLIIVLVGCWTAGAGLNRFFTYMQIVPWVQYSNSTQMQNYETIKYIPQDIWPAGGYEGIGDNQEEKQRVYDAFFTGYEQQGTDGIPWDAWMPSLLTNWLPLLALFSICLIALSLIVHRQWAHHEQLSYPIAQIGTTLFMRDENRRLPSIFYMRSFWIAAGTVMLFHGVRLLHAWWPNNYPDINYNVQFSFIWSLFPTFGKSGAFWLNSFSFFFSIIGICYFLSREIGLTIGLSQIILAILSMQLYLSTGNRIGSEDTSNMRAGAYIAYAAMILFTGRNYYKSVFVKAFNFKEAADHEKDGVYAARILMFAFVGLVIVLCTSFDLEFPMALIYSLLSLLLYLVFTRIICETGIPYLQVAWSPGIFMTKIFGASAIGAAPLAIMYYLGGVLFSDPKEAMMPYVANSFKMADNYQLKLRRLCTIVIAVVTVAIFVSISARVYQHYTLGANKIQDSYGSLHVPKNFLENTTRDLTQLEDIGQRSLPGEAHKLGFFERIGSIDFEARTIIYVLAGAAGVVLFFMLRFRYTGFLLHPVIFLIWDTYPIQKTFYSFLVGWFIRELVVRFGGGKVYQDCKPFFIGLIFGELFMGVFGIGAGLLYHAFTNELPPQFRVFVS